MDWLSKLNRKFGRFAIPRLMVGLSVIMLGVYIAGLLIPSLYYWLNLDVRLVMQGQVWRLITFIFLPPNSSPIWLLFSLYFYCLIGNGLENQWGAFRFNVFYLCGILGAIIAAFLTGYGANTYLNLSLFLAFAVIYPDFQVLIFFILPVKIKYLAYIDIVIYVLSLIFTSWPQRIALLMSLVNLAIFFGPDFFKNFKDQSSYRKTRKNFRKYYK